MRSFKRSFTRGLVSLFASVRLASAQTITGSVTGTVTDPLGAIVAGGSVTATKSDTGALYAHREQRRHLNVSVPPDRELHHFVRGQGL